MNESTARRHLGPHLPLLRSAVADGFADYAREYGNVSHKHSPRTRASAIHDHIVDYVKRKLSGTNIRFVPSRVRNLFSADNALVLQFKKLNPGLKPSNYPTQLALNFDAQVNTGYLPGMEASPRLTIGYVPNVAFTGLNGVFVVYLSGKTVIWSFEIPDTDTGESAVIGTLFTPSSPGSRVKPKKTLPSKEKRNRDAQS
jgi:hypothetical protein